MKEQNGDFEKIHQRLIVVFVALFLTYLVIKTLFL